MFSPARLFARLRNAKEVPLKDGAKKNWLGGAEEEEEEEERGGKLGWVRINRGRMLTCCCFAASSSQLIQHCQTISNDDTDISIQTYSNVVSK